MKTITEYFTITSYKGNVINKEYNNLSSYFAILWDFISSYLFIYLYKNKYKFMDVERLTTASLKIMPNNMRGEFSYEYIRRLGMSPPNSLFICINIFPDKFRIIINTPNKNAHIALLEVQQVSLPEYETKDKFIAVFQDIKPSLEQDTFMAIFQDIVERCIFPDKWEN